MTNFLIKMTNGLAGKYDTASRKTHCVGVYLYSYTRVHLGLSEVALSFIEVAMSLATYVGVA